jgi:fructosamine-3-kinase
MSSPSRALKRHGPTEKVTFSREQADKLFQVSLNKKISRSEPVTQGLNNLIFFIDCENDVQRYVLKICGDAWEYIKTESEVNAMKYIAKYTTIPVPKVIAHSSNKNNEFGVEWIIMTHTGGKPLRTSDDENDIWSKLSIDQKRSIINQLVEYVSQLHKKIPRSNQIGNYKSDGQIGQDNELMGPWNNYKEYFYDRLKLTFKTINEQNVYALTRNNLIELIKEVQTLTLPSFDDLPNVFTHNDLGLQNVTVDNDYQINGIIDWEWGGSYPICEEYFHSYKSIVVDEQLTNYLYDQLEQHHLPTPRTIPHFSLLQKLYDLLQTIAPWYLNDLINPEDPMVEKELFKNRDKVEELVQQIKEDLK